MTEYRLGEAIEWRDWCGGGRWLPGIVSAVHQEMDAQGVFMWIEITLYNGRTRRCCAPEIRAFVRRPPPAVETPPARVRPFGCSSDCRAPGCGGGCSQ